MEYTHSINCQSIIYYIANILACVTFKIKVYFIELNFIINKYFEFINYIIFKIYDR